jgi:beta-lactamase class A
VRHLLACALALTLAACAGAVTPQPPPTLDETLARIARSHRGNVALFAENLTTGATAGVRPDDVVKSASTIKLAVLLEGFHQIDAGQKRLDDALALKPEDQVPGSAVLAHLRAPATITFQDALTFMVIVSDNTAMNLAIDHVGLARVNARLSQLGLRSTWLYKKVYKPAEGPMPSDQPRYGLGKTTPREMAALMKVIARCDLKDRALCDAMRRILQNQQYREAIPRYLESLDFSEIPSRIGAKTGALDDLRADVAWIDGDNADVIIAAYTYDNKDERWTPDNEGYLTIARMAKAIIDGWGVQITRGR